MKSIKDIFPNFGTKFLKEEKEAFQNRGKTEEHLPSLHMYSEPQLQATINGRDHAAVVSA